MTMVQPLLLENSAVTGSPVAWPGGEGTFHVVGTFGGATVQLERLGPDGTTWTTVPNTGLTSDSMVNFSLGVSILRAEVVGGTPSGLYAVAAGTTR